MIEATQVTRVYRTGSVDVVALDSVDLEIQAGELVAVMGPSGCGKTTLLNCLSGLDEVSSGEITIEGTSLAKMSDAERTRYRAARMGFVFQAFNLLPVFTAVENVELPMLLLGSRSSGARKKATEALAAVGLAERANHRPAELSGGEQQRVAIARSIVADPAVVWADEPTGNLDTENADKIIDLLVKLNVEKQITIVMVTHDAEVGGRAGRLVKMLDGRITSEDTSEPATPSRSRPDKSK